MISRTEPYSLFKLSVHSWLSLRICTTNSGESFDDLITASSFAGEEEYSAARRERERERELGTFNANEF